ncbi:hypothetical protein NST83_07475 [Paenibacillus sp. FSL R10-2782]|uniref:hypothetical protein n=1 Tax=Paenibacillus sp. FSL R10-2782 TaxID=2954661 RepID=UPI0031585166
MSRKLIVSKSQAEALAAIISNQEQFEAIQAHMRTDGLGWSRLDRAALNGMNIENLIGALVFGYEVEKTPEEKLLYMYENPLIRYAATNSLTTAAYKQGIADALNAVGKVIEGINAITAIPAKWN